MNKSAVLIAGPTASGKSALALARARETGGVVVNTDALQVYGGLRVLTARPGPDETAAVPHRLYGTVAPETRFSTGGWARAVGGIGIETFLKPVTVQRLTEAGLASIRSTVEEVQSTASRIRNAMEVQAQTVTMITAAVDETALAADSMSSNIATIRSDTENVAAEIDAVEQGFGEFTDQIDGFAQASEEFALNFAA